LAQDISTLNEESFLKNSGEAACKCIDSISTFDKSKVEVAKEISKCIDEHTLSYQLSMKIFSNLDLKNLDLKSADKSDKKKNVKISINTDENSNDYKKYYYEIERYLMANCKAIKEKIASNEKQNDKSFSKNPTALNFYSKGLNQIEKEDYKDAIKYFEKAINEDANFAFAWDNLGVCYRKLNDYDKAIEAYNKSLALDPYGLMPLQNIAIVYQYKKEYQNAINSYEKLALIDNENPEVYYGIGLVYFSYLNNSEKGLENTCKAYNLYVQQKSPYRADAEKVINLIFADMKKQGKEKEFNEILKANHISPK
jgi:tetratricopeptide (TPR) repeat protein